MNDELSGYQDWQAAFAEWTDISISELHGILTALVCAITPPTIQQWQQILAELSLTIPSDEALKLLGEYGEDVGFCLQDESDAYAFLPLVPDDTHDLWVRMSALKDWAGGFITGIGVADCHLRQDEQQILADVGKIAAIRSAQIQQLQADDAVSAQDEEEYLQLYEFARMAPVLLSMRQKRKAQDLAIIKGLASDRKTAHELKLPKTYDITPK